MKLIDILAEAARSKPKAVIMAGGAGVGKSTLLNKLDLASLPLVNPDKYVEDPDHPAHNNLAQGSRLADQEAEELSNNKESFVWDTTASNPKKVKAILDNGYDVFMVMVYTHPMISYIANSKRGRKVPAAGVFSTWRNVYQLISEYAKMLNGNIAIHVNDRGGEFSKEVEAFNIAAKNGPQGIKDYLQKYNQQHGVEGSTFFKPVEMSQEEEEEFKRATSDIDWDKENRSEDKAIKQAFLKGYQANGVSPGDDKLIAAVKKYRETREKNQKREDDVLENIAEMLFSPTFQELLQHSTPQEIDQKVQEFLA